MTPNQIERLARNIVKDLKGIWNSNGGLCLCPVHGDNSPSLSVRVGKSNILVKCFAGCEGHSIMSKLREMQLLTEPAHRQSDTPSYQPCERDFSELAKSIWSASSPIRRTPGQSYLQGRSINQLSDSLRYNKSLVFNHNGERRQLSGIVARISTDDAIVGVLRILLTRDGRKAPIDGQKRVLGKVAPGAVRLQSADNMDTLGLAEGCETGMSANSIFNVPVWSTLGTEFFANVAIPRHVRRVKLFLDNGKGGDRAEKLFRQRSDFTGHVEAYRPHKNFSDFNELQQHEAGLRPQDAVQ